MRSTSARQRPFTVGNLCLLGMFVFSGWAGCQANFDGTNSSASQGGATGQPDGGQASGGQGSDGAADGFPASDTGLSVVPDGAAGDSRPPQGTDAQVREAGIIDPRDGAGGAGGTGGQTGGTTATGGNTLLPDAGTATAIDAPLGGTTNSSDSLGGNTTGGTTSGGQTSTGISTTGGTTGGATGGATGGNTSLPPDAGLDGGISPDAYVPPDTMAVDLVDASPWRLVWSDEFDREANAGVAGGKWTVSNWEPGTVNNEVQKYTARPQNLFHDGDGHLVVRALHDSYRVGPNANYAYTSARIQTDGKFAFKFGRVEIRAKLPAGQGSFPGMILMGTNGSWPSCGEIALMEQYGQDKTSFYCSTYSDSQSDLNQKIALPSTTSPSTEFHTYALEWYADHVVFFFDDTEVARRDFGATSPFANANNDFYLILDVALGGKFGGDIDDAAFPMDMTLDYVRVYAL